MGRMEEILGKTVLSELDVKWINRQLNRGKLRQEDVFTDWEKPYRIDEAMTQKGHGWLMDLWKTPRGVERKNNPFGYREQHVLENFSHFKLTEFFNASHAGQSPYYTPLWTVVASDRSTFQYYLWGGEINITG